MAATQQYSLRWNNYFRHLTYALDNHRSNDDLVDVSLCCDGRKIKAHKVVLSSCSSYFKEIFKENPHPHPVIIFKFIKFEDLNSIVEFMYQGEVNVQQEALQSFLQTAELLAVQGLTAEEKEKPRAPPAPIIDERKLMKTIPSTIRAMPCHETGTATTQTTSQTIEIPAGTLIQTQPAPTQVQHIQIQQQAHPTHLQASSHQHQHATHHQQQQTQQLQSQQQQQQQQQQHHTVVTNALTLPGSAIKKRKLTFSDVDDDNLYTTETVDYAVKDDPTTIVKATEMTFLHRAVKMDMPTEYIVSEVDESQQLSDSNTQQNAQDNNAEVGQAVAQYTSEYEILTESEIEEKYQQADADNTEITIEMGRLLNTAANTSGNAAQSNLEDTNVLSSNAGVATTKTDSGKSGSSTNLPSNKWTECQLCKMVITTVNLWRHIRTQHTPQPPRKCELCNKNFKNKYSLREHIRISHEQKLTEKSEN